MFKIASMIIISKRLHATAFALLLVTYFTVDVASSKHLRSTGRSIDAFIYGSSQGADNVITQSLLSDVSGMTKGRHLQQQRVFPFRRYLVTFQGDVNNPSNSDCQPPIPTINIRCSANLQLVELDDTVSCTDDLRCTGAGRVLVDCVARNNLFDLTTGLSLSVAMDPPTDKNDNDFSSCDDVGLIGQGFGVGIVCPDNSATFNNLACDPITTFVPGDVRSCLARCIGDCTDLSDLPNIVGEVLVPSSCLWEPEDFEVNPTEMPIETSLPSSSPTPLPSDDDDDDKSETPSSLPPTEMPAEVPLPSSSPTPVPSNDIDEPSSSPPTNSGDGGGGRGGQNGPCYTMLPPQQREWDGGLVLLKNGDALHSCEGNSDAWYFFSNTDFYMKQRNDGNFVVRCGQPGNSRIVWQTDVHVLDEERDNGANTKLFSNGDLVTKRGKVKDDNDTIYSSAKEASQKYGDGDEGDYLGPEGDYFFALTNNGRKVQIWRGTPTSGGDELIWEDYTQYRGCKPGDYWK